MRLPVEIAGKPLDFTEAGISIPVVHVRVASIFAELAPEDVQLIPVDVEGHPDQYLILVATRLLDCIDEKASRFDRWTPEEGVVHKIRRYSIMYQLRIDKAKVGTARCSGARGGGARSSSPRRSRAPWIAWAPPARNSRRFSAGMGG